MTLRHRLLLGVLVLVAAGLLVADAATAATLRSFLLHRVDSQLVGAHNALTRRFGILGVAATNPPALPTGATGATNPTGGGGRGLGPSEFFIEVVGSDNKPIATFPASLRAEHEPPPNISRQLLTKAIAADGQRVGPFTTGAQGGSTSYRVVLQRTPAGSDVLVAAVSLNELQTTFRRLVVVEVGVSATVLIGIALLALWVVRLGLRPLDAMAGTAGAIAAGDLSQRVDAPNQTDEVGRLAAALNAMLAQIEAAFAERAESEDRLRRFVADASHELRTPLTTIRGYAELFRHGAAEGDDIQALMRNIEEQSARMGVLVDDLLLLARLDQHRPLERRPVDLTELAAAAVGDAHAAEPERPIVLRTEGEPVIEGDRHRLRQILDNLLTNVRVHTPPNTPVTVRVRRDEDQAVIDVSDEGPGMTPEVAERVFERFFRADPSRARDRGGSGLGLSIVRAVAEAHGGRVSVASAPGQGSTFTVRLPAGDTPAGPDDHDSPDGHRAGATPALTELPGAGQAALSHP